MRAVVYRKFGGPEVLEVTEDHPLPQRKAGEVLIKVYSASCNPLDCKFRNGSIPIAVYDKVPALCNLSGNHFLAPQLCDLEAQILGVDIAGVVEAADETSKVRDVQQCVRAKAVEQRL